MNNSLLRTLALPILFCLSSLSHAALIVFTSEASFIAATSAQGVDTFSDLVPGTVILSPINRNAGVYGYTGTSPGGFFAVGTAGDPALSTNFANDSITFDNFTGGAQAIGANFFDSDLNGAFASGSITVTAVDQTGTVTQTIINATEDSFLGFVSTDSLVSLTVTTLDPNLFATVDNLTIGLRAGGNPTPVPAPGSMVLLLGGLGIMGLSARRRRRT